MTSLTKSFAQKCAGLLLTSALAATSVSAQEVTVVPEGTDTAAPERPEIPDQALCKADIQNPEIIMLPYVGALDGQGQPLFGFIGMIEKEVEAAEGAEPEESADPSAEPEAEAEPEYETTGCLYKLGKAPLDTPYLEKMRPDMTAPKLDVIAKRIQGALDANDTTMAKLCSIWTDNTTFRKAPTAEQVISADPEGDTLMTQLQIMARQKCPDIFAPGG